MKGKNLYLCFWSPNPESLTKSRGYWSEWWTKHDELCKEYGVKLIYIGTPYGHDWGNIFIYEGGCDTEKYYDFRVRLNNMEGSMDKRVMWLSNTMIVQLLDKPSTS